MNIPPSDERIRKRFQALRAEAEGAAPDFRAMLERAREDAGVPTLRVEPARRVRGRRILWASGVSGAAVAAALAAVLLTRDRSDPDAEFERLVAQYSTTAATDAWRSPTDALLNVPGSGLTRALPSVGTGLEGGL